MGWEGHARKSQKIPWNFQPMMYILGQLPCTEQLVGWELELVGIAELYIGAPPTLSPHTDRPSNQPTTALFSPVSQKHPTDGGSSILNFHRHSSKQNTTKTLKQRKGHRTPTNQPGLRPPFFFAGFSKSTQQCHSFSMLRLSDRPQMLYFLISEFHIRWQKPTHLWCHTMRLSLKTFKQTRFKIQQNL